MEELRLLLFELDQRLRILESMKENSIVKAMINENLLMSVRVQQLLLRLMTNTNI